MRAMILAAGRGERMRPLTDRLPKPMLAVGGKPLIVWHIERLVAAGITDIVINHAWLGERIEAGLGDGSTWGARIRYSAEMNALETAGGIAQALPMLGEQPFLVINGDIFCDWDPGQAAAHAKQLQAAQARAWLLLVDNPAHHPRGDFALEASGWITSAPTLPCLTFAGIGIYEPTLFSALTPEQPAPLAPLLRDAIVTGTALGQHHRGAWTDVGTPERLRELDTILSADGISQYQ